MKVFSKNSRQEVHPNFAKNLRRQILGNTSSGPPPPLPKKSASQETVFVTRSCQSVVSQVESQLRRIVAWGCRATRMGNGVHRLTGGGEVPGMGEGRRASHLLLDLPELSAPSPGDDLRSKSAIRSRGQTVHSDSFWEIGCDFSAVTIRLRLRCILR